MTSAGSFFGGASGFTVAVGSAFTAGASALAFFFFGAPSHFFTAAANSALTAGSTLSFFFGAPQSPGASGSASRCRAWPHQ